MASPYLGRARKRERIRKARELAPRHPSAPEARLRLETAKLLRQLHNRIRSTLVAYAEEHLRQPVTASWRDKASPRLRSLFDELWIYGHNLLSRLSFARLITQAAEKTAESARKQVSKAIRAEVPASLKEQTDELASGVHKLIEDRINDSLDRGMDVWEEWDDLDPDTSPRARDTGALDDMLDAGLGGILGSALAGVGLIYGSSWGDMNKEAQISADIQEYLWISRRDGRVRDPNGPINFGYHLPLDNNEGYSWKDPPLKADKSTNGEDCHPGEDINCRCVAAPLQ